ncbi:LOW QUALITY PROTEIN: soluble lamin-associated protein of 75 kDa [Erinaceus europaeus]|uniref:LOW QUALITY PROTEIN: soluble lamin-associated protein of 75 kDa n=1 Tax=Erinaceus europaeus TaxID=9365 RepID=A0ABM3Y6X0_ERIEU|nr:LOW QUALITY PROTEIN: soluble lamin-associated protein of 75 kDa [Erinaceus europaeus]
MAFPVDLLGDCSHQELESSAEDYMSDLRCGDPDHPECFPLLHVTIPISLSNIGFLPLYGGDQTQRILALFAPEDSLTAVALYLADRWWAVDDIVRTSVPSREGLQQVRTLGERVVLYVLNRIIYRKQEMERNETPFLCHGSTDYAKILWEKGEAIGFYSVKPTGSTCTSFLTQSYQLPVLDTMFIRKKHRGRDLGLHMLEDFVDSFTEDALGLRYPLSSLLYTACKQYFDKYPGDHELLWEVEGVGHWCQRVPVSRALQRETLRIATAVSQNDARKPMCGEYGLVPVPDCEARSEDGQPSETQLTIDSLKDTFASPSEGQVKAPVSTQFSSLNCQRNGFLLHFFRSEPTPRTSESSEECLDEEAEHSGADFEDESSDQEAQPAPEAQTRPEKQGVEKESELEPMNGEMMDDTLQNPPRTEEEDSTSGVLDGESELQPLSSIEDATSPVPVEAEPSKSPESNAQDKVSPGQELNWFRKNLRKQSIHGINKSDGSRPRELVGITVSPCACLPGGLHCKPVTAFTFQADSEAMLSEGPAEEQGQQHPEDRPPHPPRKKAHLASSEHAAAAGPGEERHDSASPGPAAAEFSEESAPENVSPNTTCSLDDQGEDGEPESRETPAEAELEDAAAPQNSGPKSPSEEQSEASSEQLDQCTQSADKIADSSSEEIEVEVPVVDRRNLRRKAKGHKGPTKKKTKLA